MKKKLFSLMFVFVLALALIPTAQAKAASDNESFVWNIGADNELARPSRYYDRTANIYYEASAKSEISCRFKIVLQKKDVFGVFHDTGAVRYATSKNVTTYNTTLERNVPGQYFKVSWASMSKGTYRVVLRKDSNSTSVRIYNELMHNQKIDT